jgi:5-formyltetrahydrofolate cyclo-ligase
VSKPPTKSSAAYTAATLLKTSLEITQADTALAKTSLLEEQIVAIQARKKNLRKLIRHKRRSLTPQQQRQAARDLYKRVVVSKAFRFSKRLTFTLARDGEISPHLLLREALRRGKHCYLPVMSRFGEDRLRFRRARKDQHDLRSNNRYGIPEPVRERACPARALSLVLLPLVAFDADGNRLGMGKGYYDHTFAFLRASHRARPLLVGLAHECQRVDKLELTVWDVALHSIVTDQAWYKPQQQ